MVSCRQKRRIVYEKILEGTFGKTFWCRHAINRRGDVLDCMEKGTVGAIMGIINIDILKEGFRNVKEKSKRKKQVKKEEKIERKYIKLPRK